MKAGQAKYHVLFALLVVGSFSFCFFAFYEMMNGENWLNNMRHFGVAGLVCALAAIIMARRIERTVTTYSLTLILLIVSIVAASGSWWVAITAPVWALLLIESRELWYGRYYVPDKRLLHPLHGLAGVLTVAYYPLLGYRLATEKPLVTWYVVLCGVIVASLASGYLLGRSSERFRVFRLGAVIGLLVFTQAWLLLPVIGLFIS